MKTLIKSMLIITAFALPMNCNTTGCKDQNSVICEKDAKAQTSCPYPTQYQCRYIINPDGTSQYVCGCW